MRYIRFLLFNYLDRFRQSIWALTGNAGYAACKWGILLILARSTDTATVGQYALAFAITAPVMMLCDMRMRTLLATDTNDDYRFSDYMKARIVLSLAAFICIVIFSNFAFGRGQFFYIVCLVGLAKVIESLGDITHGLFLKTNSIFNMCVSLLSKGLLSVVLFLSVMFLTEDVVYACASLSVAFAIPFIFYDLPVARGKLPKTQLLFNGFSGHRFNFFRPDTESVIRLIRASSVLGVVALLGSLFSNVTNYVIGSTLGDSQLGVYAAIAYFGVAGRIVATSFYQPTLPQIAEAYRAGNIAAFKKNYAYGHAIALFLGLAGCIVAGVSGDTLLIMIYGSHYSGQGEIFLMIMIAASAFYLVQFQWVCLTAMNKLNAQLPLSLVTIILVLGFALLWAPEYGITGAVSAEILAYCTHVVLGFVYIWTQLKRSNKAPG